MSPKVGGLISNAFVKGSFTHLFKHYCEKDLE